jgi:dynein heavy chain
MDEPKQYRVARPGPSGWQSLAKSPSVFEFQLSDEYRIQGAGTKSVASLGLKSMQIAEEEEDPDDKFPEHLRLIRDMYSQRKDDGEELDLALPGHEEIDDEQLLRMERDKMKNGEDAIAFFAKNGAQTPIKFVYCNRAQSEDFAPYMLEVVPEDRRNPEYFTISATGVVHVCPGQPCEYLSLAEWMHQSLMYSVLTSMNFFKFYINRKVFSRWSGNARYATYCHNRKKLARRLFLAKPLFVGPLVKIQSICYEVECVRVLHFEQKAYALSDFAEIQSQTRSNAMNGAVKEFEHKHEQVATHLDKLREKVNRSTEVHSTDDGRAKAKSMVQEKQEHLEQLRHRRIAVRDQGMLGECIRLVDHMFHARLVRVAVSAAQEFAQKAETTQKMFTVSVSFAPQGGTVLDPPAASFLQMLSELWKGIVAVINGVQPFTSQRNFQDHVNVVHTLPVEQVILENREFTAFVADLRERFRTDLEKSQVMSDDQYKPYREIHDFGERWDAGGEEELKNASVDQEELVKQMTKMKLDLDKIETRFKANTVCGVVSLEGKGLKERLLPIPRAALETMKKLLLGVAKEKVAIVLQQYAAAIKTLEDRPKQLDSFAKYMQDYSTIQSSWGGMDIAKQEVEDIYLTLRQYQVRIPSDDDLERDKLMQKAKDFEENQLSGAMDHIKGEKAAAAEDSIKKAQKIDEEMQQYSEELMQGNIIDEDAIASTPEVLEELYAIGEKIKSNAERSQVLSDYFHQFEEKEPYEFEQVESAKTLYNLKLELWETVEQWQGYHRTWYTAEFPKAIKFEDMNKMVNATYKVCHKLSKKLEGDAVVDRVKEMVQEWRGHLPVIQDLCNPAIKARHWEKIYKAVNIPWKGGGLTNLTLYHLEQNDIYDQKDLVQEISAVASGEHTLEMSLDKVINAWDGFALPIMNHRNQKDLWILADVADMTTMLEDHMVSIQTMMGSRFIAGIRDKVEIWEKKIVTSADVLDEWLQVQRAWMYLENIFSAEDIQKQLPQESNKFKQVDKFWKETFRKVRQNFRMAMDAMNIPNLLNQLQWANTTLDQIQKQLENYLETKRAAFPRFYFLSNDELLSILSQTRNPHAVQEHLSKCFDSISRVTFREGTNQILGMQDMIKEYAAFHEEVTAGAQVELWLNQIEFQMVMGLYQSTKAAFLEYPEDPRERHDWLLGEDVDGQVQQGQLPYCSQGQLAVDMIGWTVVCEEALNKIEAGEDPKAMEHTQKFLEEQLQNSVAFVRLDLSKLARTMMGALIVLDVHNLTVLKNMITEGCTSVNDFMWSKQLRYYWEAQIDTAYGQEREGDVTMKQTIARFICSYEYLGNTPRLVITPLTDKCYMTLTGAMHLNYGGAPAGPAGTGKTETTKDLGKALQVPVIVFNCSDGLDYKIMGRFFSGLAQAGSWACFDEFNRIQVEVLSVIAQQMLTITQAIRGKKEIFEFNGSEIPLNPRFGVFITMNPGYAGRTELPDNLKSLFRPVAMMVPDYALIAEIILYSEGFGTANTLAQKMNKLYSLSSEQLSKQDHYDFGMRAVKSVLVMAGQLKRKYSELPENVTLIRALRDSNVPKFLSHDLPLFFGIIKDLFPGLVVPSVDYGSLQTEIENQLSLVNYQRVPTFVTKIIQLLETQLVRHGVMVVGLASTGKTSVTTTLARALTELRKNDSDDVAHQKVKISQLNPKSVTMFELYGSFNDNTGEWADGLVAILVREAVQDQTPSKKWVNFDGPVDAIWIENMNTVLDDNKMLCLANGERIKLAPTMTMMFEVGDLAVASPATVSRCGMVYLEYVHLGWQNLIHTWKENFASELPAFATNVHKWVLMLCEACIPFIRESCSEAPGIPSADVTLVANFLKLINTYICLRNGIPRTSDEAKSNKTDAQQDKLVRMYVLYSLFWSLGGNLHDKSRTKFQNFVKPKLKTFCPDFPEHDDMYQISVDVDAVAFIRVQEIVPEFTYDPELPFFNLVVPTVESTVQQSLLENISSGGYSILMAGETGIGKTVGIMSFLNGCGESYSTATANFSAQTSSANVVDMFESKLERKRKNLLGPPAGTRMVIFVDDVNMPMLETYGAQPPIELLRQAVDQGGFYDQKKLFFKAVADTQFIISCGPPGGGKMPVTPRFFRHFNMIWMTSLSEEAMRKIFSSILAGWAAIVRPELAPSATPMVQTVVEAFFRISEDLLPTPVKCHYTFNLRDPAKIVQGILQVSKPWMQDKKADHKERFVKLFVHEMSRQFRDRLTDDNDRNWFDGLVQDKLKVHLRTELTSEEFSEILFSDFLDRAEKPYQIMDDPKKLSDLLNEFLEDYNVTYPAKMNLVFFQDAQRHLLRASRIVRQPRGNALLVGVSGVGRKSQSRMAAHICEYQCFSIEITRSYGPADFKEDLKTMMMDVIKGEGKGLVFLFSDTQIVKESFLEDVNNILNTGQVPNLFAPDEMEQVISGTRPLAKAAGKPDSRDAIWQHFVQVVRNSLHIVLAFSPVGDGFRARCRQFPSLINCATIDWYDPWPAEALESVAQRAYAEAPAELGIMDFSKGLSALSSVIHVSSADSADAMFEALRRKTYTTPTSFLELMKIFLELFGKLKEKLNMRLQRYQIGGEKMTETRAVVETLQQQITEMQPVLKKASEETAELMIQVENDKVEASAVAEVCAVEEAAAAKAAGEANEIKADCQKDLDEALPEFYSAMKSLDALDKKDLQELKSFAKPPPLVETVTSAV